jgi:cytochrome c-type biogenesis protein CcmE
MIPKKAKHRRLLLLCLMLSLLGGGAYLVITSLQDNMVFFLTPKQLSEKEIDISRPFRLGGLVEKGSLKKLADGMSVQFTVTDNTAIQKVQYRGALPDLFREGQGVVTYGRLNGAIFEADEILAKHDENYMPPQIAEAIKASGEWRSP